MSGVFVDFFFTCADHLKTNFNGEGVRMVKKERKKTNGYNMVHIDVCVCE